jgi:hypothetical protein
LPVLVEMTGPALAGHADLSQFRAKIPPFAVEDRLFAGINAVVPG